VFRYAEIYILRGLGISDLSASVLSALEERYRNFQRLYHDCEGLSHKHWKRYMFTRAFYEDLRGQGNRNVNSFCDVCGPVGVLNVFVKHISGRGVPIYGTAGMTPFSSEDGYVTEFLRKLNDEIKQFMPPIYLDM
jgi:hypothetical protein